MKRPRHLISIEQVRHATSLNLRILNENLSGLSQYEDLKVACRSELKRRKKLQK